MSRFEFARTTALVTGASRGIGAAIARELAVRGAPSLVLVARSKDDLEALASELFHEHGTRVETIVADLAEGGTAVSALKAETDRRGLTIDLLVNNAGFGKHGTFESVDAKTDSDMIAVNIDSLVALTHAYLPGMEARDFGGVINIASTAGFQPVPYLGVYSATKAFVLSFTEALHVEMRDKGSNVRIIALCPGSTETDFGDGLIQHKFDNRKKNSPEEVAQATLEALEKNHPVAIVGATNTMVASLSPRLFPRGMVANVAGNIFRPDDIVPPADPKKTAAAVGGAAALLGLGAAAFTFWKRRKDEKEEDTETS